MTEHVKVEVTAGVMTLTLQRPEKKERPDRRHV
ncbi:enoyl-CoA hydratase/carnithine racemase [Bradyrhizobium sp. USDA 4350]